MKSSATKVIEVQDDIPIPRKSSWNAKYPWWKMEVGSSFFVDDTTQKKLTAAATYSLGVGNYAVRSTFENGKSGYRVWRTA